jgi:hypothetical protein
MFVRTFVCYVLVFTLAFGSVGNLFAGWHIWSNVVSYAVPPGQLTSMWEVDANRHWEHRLYEWMPAGFGGVWAYRAQWAGSAHPTFVGHNGTMMRNHAALTNNPATCETRLYDLGPVGPPVPRVQKKVSATTFTF